ncbi:MAG: peptidylprolyl isomerase [Bacteroidia bacterium]|nr:peptidylprolyl isomerase [Bacteroidia bacterium]
MFRAYLFSLLLCLNFSFFQAQSEVIDRVIAVVGKYPILLSDLQSSMLQRENQGLPPDKCRAFEMLLYQKLLVAQADRDSVTVSDAEVDQELSRRMAFFIQQFGSEEKLEEFYGKRTNVIKDELRADVQEQMLAERMAGQISGNTKVSPAEIREFYNAMPEDSLPLVESEVELQQLVRKPVWSKEAKEEAKALLESYRQRVIKGQASMSTLARLYSEDPGSAREGGIYKNVSRGTMEPAFDATAFRLKNGEISEVFETSYGYHFIELVQRKGEVVDLRHILIIPKMTASDFFTCKRELDTLYKEMNEGKISFEDAVKKYSDDKDTKQNAGLMINPRTASTKFDNEILSQLDQNLIVTLAGMNVGDISKPMEFMDMDGKRAYRILKLKNRIDPHRTNLKDDYQKLATMAVAEKNRKLIKDWIKKRSATTYIKLDTGFDCTYENNWTISN